MSKPDDTIPPALLNLPDRWTKAKMAAFLRELAATHSVKAAARAVRMSRQSAYKLRNRLKGEPFDIAWEAAFQHGYDALHQAALERALHGVEVPVYFKGELIGTRRHFNEQLTCFLLAARNRNGAHQLGRCRAAADYWAEQWDKLLNHVAHGAVHWRGNEPRDDDAALAASSRYTAPDPPPRGHGG